jgi:hypothetical protein
MEEKWRNGHMSKMIDSTDENSFSRQSPYRKMFPEMHDRGAAEGRGASGP